MKIKDINSKTFSHTNDDSAEVPTQLFQHLSKVVSSQHLASNEKEDTHRSKTDDPGGDGHHSIRETGEEVQQRFTLLTKLGQSNAKNNSKGDETKNVRTSSPTSFEFPSQRIRRIPPLIIFIIVGFTWILALAQMIILRISDK